MTRKSIHDLITPSVLVDLDRLEKNISYMAIRAKEGGVNLRPHIKTHKCLEIGKKQIDAGAKGITVSTLGEAMAFADAGFKDITYAVPLAPDKFEGVKQISERTHLNVLVDHPIIADQLGLFCKKVGLSIDVLVKVDCGLTRTGVNPEIPAAISLVKKIHSSPNLNFMGILTHAGHSYAMTTVADVKTIARHEQDVMIRFAKTLKAESAELAPEVVSIGSTPTTRLADTFQEGITEIRPGNYVFFDYTQVVLGSCESTDCALTVLSSVISANPDRAVIDAGATALSKDKGPTNVEPDVGYGKIIKDYAAGKLDTEVMIALLSQEHGKLTFTRKTSFEYELGEKIRIIPNHSCLTANLFDYYQVVKGDSVVDKWRVQRERFE
ncbi:MAG: alanine racemase [Candidatus Thorarchaeota archaeon]|jgi:D-serine deaminase-like pyridoxal phosphate-dependent protein